MQFSSVESLIESIRQGEMVILVDDESRENEGDLVIAGEKITAEHLRFMAREACGLICLSLSKEHCERLNLNTVSQSSNAERSTAFTPSIEAAHGIDTGISAKDRAHTILTASSPQATHKDIVQPGHMFPLKAREGGVIARAGHTESSVDLVKLAGLHPASAIVEIMNEDGTMARRKQLQNFSARHQIKIGTIASLIRYRLRTEKVLNRVSEQKINTLYGTFTQILYQDIAGNTHVALVSNPACASSEHCSLSNQSEQNIVSCMHSLNLWADLLAKTPATEDSLPMIMDAISKSGAGVIVIPHVQSELSHVVDNLPTTHANNIDDSVCAQWLRSGITAQVLKELGVKKTQLINRSASHISEAFSDQAIEVL